MTRYVLTRLPKNTMVHRAECHMGNRGKAQPWQWADTVTPADVVQAVIVADYRTCAYCRPIGGKPGQVR